MAIIQLRAKDLVLVGEDNGQVTCGDVGVHVMSYLDGPSNTGVYYPVLSVAMKTDCGQTLSSMRIESYEEIDALRRYCEMTLDLFDRGRLE